MLHATLVILWRSQEAFLSRVLLTTLFKCPRFPDNELVREMARKKGSVAQAELDRRHEENHS